MKALHWKTAGAAVVARAFPLGAVPSRAATPAEGRPLTPASTGPDLSVLPLTDRHLNPREKANLAAVLQAYDTAEGDKLNVPAFEAVFARNGVFNDVVAGHTYQGEALGQVLNKMVGILPDVHRELKQITVHGDVISIELSVRGTFNGSLPTPAGTLKGNGAKVDIPTADFWYLRNGKVEKFDCYLGYSAFYTQLGVNWDWAAAVGNN
ncbi:nuclear transport factor 2 family protein [Dactylosporangium sp. McL0621]|uniref:nuclear transport factor 2 family protein n=1 Tax=Dactylosporangium sp. McL0621 TaxID=3415678 RepID=UPI003CE9FF9A